MGETKARDEKDEFLEIYKKLDPIGRADVLSRAAFALEIQESTKKKCIEAMKAMIDGAGEKPAA